MIQGVKIASAAALMTLGGATGAVLAQEGETLSTSSAVAPMSGELAEAKALAPTYDGPVKWGAIDGRTELNYVFSGIAGGVLVGMLGGLVVGGVAGACKKDGFGNSAAGVGAISGLVGGLVAGGIAGGVIGERCFEPENRIVQFSTVVQSIERADSPHAEDRVVQRGKSRVTITESPFYSGLVTIPESNLFLAANSYRAPLILGEKINATFYLDMEGHVLSWLAEPAARPVEQNR